MPAFRGTITQVPPAYSALKYQGRSHYEYARAGIDVPRAPREVHVALLALTAWRAPDATLDVGCSKGTYVRMLAADLGAALGCGAHLAALRRVATGGFSVADAVTLADFERMGAQAGRAALLPVDALLRDLPLLAVGADDARRLRDGRPIGPIADAPARCRAYAPDGALLGVLARSGDSMVPERMARSGDPTGAARMAPTEAAG